MDIIKVIYILSNAMYMGGTEAFIMNYYKYIDHEKIQIDFIYQGYEDGVYDKVLLDNGSRIYHVPFKSRHPIRFSSEVKRILKEGKYQVIHSQMDAMGCWPLAIAKSIGVPMRIAHSHNTKHQTNNPIKLFLNDTAKIFLRKYATDYYACGYDAGVFMFGKKLMAQNKVQIIHNAIELDKYAFSRPERDKIRSEFGIKNEYVIGHVGQFREQKNHKKIIEIFSEIVKTDSNVKLMLVGDGPLKSDIYKMVEKRNILDKVIFTGARNDVCDLINAFDVFLFPSLFEGLGIVAIEAQANGLPAVVSDVVPDEALITDIIMKVELNAEPSVWKEAVYKALKSGRKNEKEKLIDAGYDILTEAKKLEEKYLNKIK